jgi:hypothetical protein
MASIYVATPMYGGQCTGIFLKSILSLVDLLKKEGHVVHFHDLYNESLINRARNTLTEMYMQTNYTHLLFIDADQGFDPRGILKMIQEDVDLIGAAVPMKGINWERVEKKVKDGIPANQLEQHTGIYNVNISKKQRELLKENPKEIFEVDYVGTGLLLIKRNVLEQLKQHVGQYRSDQPKLGNIEYGDPIYDFWKTIVDPKSERLLSEDYNFCKLWKDIGGKVFVAPYVKVTHVGTYIFQ